MSSRVAEIQSNIQPSQLRLTPTEHNVADDMSRGLSVAKLSQRWKNGPEFLRRSETEWPVEDAPPDPNEVEKECRKTIATAVMKEEKSTMFIDCQRFSSWNRLLRVTAWVLRVITRFLSKLKPEKKDSSSSSESLTRNELEKSRNFWIKKAQIVHLEIATDCSAMEFIQTL